MKALYSLLILLFLINYSAETCDMVNPENRKVCINATLDKNQIKCCYVEVAYNDTDLEKDIFCKGFNEEEFDRMRGDFINFVKERNETAYKNNGTYVQRAEIDCKASYIIVSMLSLILILL